jgi:DNA-directed RNA polymerase subunit beta
VKGENVPEPGVPESFKVLIKELQSLSLDVRVLTEANEEVEIKEDEDDVGETARELELDERDEPGSRVIKKSAPALDEAEEEEELEEELNAEELSVDEEVEI